jgi:hypothetical protein
MSTVEDKSRRPLLRIEGGAFTGYERFGVAAVEPGAEASFLLQPQLPFRPDRALVYAGLESEGARARVVRAIWNGEPLELGPSDMHEPASRGALCEARFLRRERRTLEIATFFELVLRNEGPAPAQFAAVADGLLLEESERLVPMPGSQLAREPGIHPPHHPHVQRFVAEVEPRQHWVGLEQVRSPSVSRRRETLEGDTQRQFETRIGQEARLRAVHIETDARPGELFVVDLRIGKNSQLINGVALPVEAFASGQGLPFDTDCLWAGGTVSLQLHNRGREPRHFSHAYLVEPTEDAAAPAA